MVLMNGAQRSVVLGVPVFLLEEGREGTREGLTGRLSGLGGARTQRRHATASGLAHGTGLRAAHHG
jgi:hypothetical protein